MINMGGKGSGRKPIYYDAEHKRVCEAMRQSRIKKFKRKELEAERKKNLLDLSKKNVKLMENLQKLQKTLSKPDPTITNLSPPTQPIFYLGVRKLTEKDLEKFEHKTTVGEKKNEIQPKAT